MQPNHPFDFVLLRGLGRQSAHWDHFPELLKKSFPESDIHLIDLPGAGRLSEINPPLTIKAFIPHLERQLSKNLRRPLVAIAVSLGGMVALTWIASKPERFDGVFLVNSSAAGLSTFNQRLKSHAAYSMIRSALALRTTNKEAWIVSMISNVPDLHAEIVERWSEVHRRAPIKRMTIIRQLIAASTFQLPQNIATKNTHVLASRHDRLCDVSCSEAIAKHLNASLAIHETAGHDLMIDDPMWVIEKIRSSLSPG